MTVGVVGTYSLDEFDNHLLQFVDELCRRIVVTFNLTKFLFPQSSEFGTLEQFFVYDAN